jgi:transcriptional regulator with XRE-family HTH domain
MTREQTDEGKQHGTIRLIERGPRRRTGTPVQDGERFEIPADEVAKIITAGRNEPERRDTQRRMRASGQPGGATAVAGNEMRSLRLAAGLSAADLASAAALPVKLIEGYEAAADAPDSQAHREQIAAALDSPVSEVFPTDTRPSSQRRDRPAANSKVQLRDPRSERPAGVPSHIDRLENELIEIRQDTELASLRQDIANLRRKLGGSRR